MKALPYYLLPGKVKDINSDDFKRIEDLERVQLDMKEQMLKTKPIFEALKNNQDIMEQLNDRMK